LHWDFLFVARGMLKCFLIRYQSRFTSHLIRDRGTIIEASL